MTDAERLLLCVLADTLLIMARNPMAAIDTARLAKARFALDEEAHRAVLCAGSGDRLASVESALHRMAEALRPATATPQTIRITLPQGWAETLRRGRDVAVKARKMTKIPHNPEFTLDTERRSDVAAQSVWDTGRA